MANDYQRGSVKQQARAAKATTTMLAASSLEQRNAALMAISAQLTAREAEIVEVNDRDVTAARAEGISEGLIDRLTLNSERIAGINQALAELAAAPDVLGQIVDGRTISDGIKMKQVRVPLGVVGMIYEARPNVTIDAAGIAIKTGNAILLRGGKIAQRTNDVLVAAIQAALVSVGLPADAVQNLDAASRQSGTELMGLHGLVDVLIPRGGEGLIKTVVENSKVPVIETGTGNCHVYVHAAANLDMAADIVMNAKVQRPSVCNAAESLLIDAAIVDDFLPAIANQLMNADVIIVADARALQIIEKHSPKALRQQLRAASDSDWGTEYLDLAISVKIVDDINQAVSHINAYGTSHSEAIVTDDYEAAQIFAQHVDAAAVYVNASTRYTDGGVFGLGAEIGISTQKLHARGPMGPAALTSTKFILEGSGQVRT